MSKVKYYLDSKQKALRRQRRYGTAHKKFSRAGSKRSPNRRSSGNAVREIAYDFEMFFLCKILDFVKNQLFA